MKLTNEQKGFNSSLRTGMQVLQLKMAKLGEKVLECEETIRMNESVDREVCNARVIVVKNEIMIRNSMIKQLNKCYGILEAQLISKENQNEK